ncbi:hypothetical protein HaLaN_31051, partial [Haematococcus lacustris]
MVVGMPVVMCWVLPGCSDNMPELSGILRL